ncbi:FAD-binding domain-containing protein [Aspergillus steynii IBT 23096]|uniref:FAD-binding domain-containing protein n=1 Tax=Aspergillus steynii IBT 23096 TaxID=1392250 RepID=A0A2I2GF93_9EURO|nr:FAD-binding domain-containing protein [Aspergillus steynii IBT 23096]PLB51549.1 FAD-binding domain-containing protein [Aspergillus steynii IBT 23096]
MAPTLFGLKPIAFYLLFYIASFVLLAPFATADICSKLEALNITVEKRITANYDSTLKNYWSAACGDLRPLCVVTPGSALEMSHVVKELQDTDDLFAVKSGGHNANEGFSSIKDGLLISTKKLNKVIYNPDDKTATIGPGLAWEDAQKGLAGTGRALVGARMGGVGVGGCMLGGGWSFLSDQYGFAANNVVNFEVVLANGTIVNANKDKNSDLFGALKGGGSNYGIVTSFKLQTHPQNHKVWGGTWTFPSHEKTPEILKAIRDFAEHNPDDKAAMIPTTAYSATVKSWTFFVFYDGPQPSKGVFDNFTSLKPQDSTKTWDSYHDLLKFMDIGILRNQRYTISTETLPVPNAAAGAKVLSMIQKHWFNITDSVIDVPGVIGSLALQPLSRKVAQKAKERGGDLYNFPTDQDYFIMGLDFSYWNATDDKRIKEADEALLRGYEEIIDDFVDDKLLPDVYRPLFLSQARGDQDYWGRLKSKSTEHANAVRERYDPDDFFQRRASGGF